MKKLFLLAFTTLLIAQSVMAQPTERARRNMNLFNYSKAIKILNHAVKKEKYRETAIPLLAECYKMQNDPANARGWYSQAVQIPNAGADTWFEYARSLMQAGEYTQANQALDKAAALAPQDPRIKRYTAYCDSVQVTWKDMAPAFEIKTLSNVNSEASDFGPAFYANGFTYASDRERNVLDERPYGWTGRGYVKLLFTKPEKTGDVFGNIRYPRSLKGFFNETYHDGPAYFAGDSVVAFTRSYHDADAKKINNVRTDMLKIFYASRVNGKWGKLNKFYLNSPDYNVGHPALTADASVMYFVSDMPGGQGGTDIWMCKRQGEGWGNAVNLGPVINTPGNEMFPSVKQDGTLYFASDGHPGYGGLDIFSSKFSDGSWSVPRNLYAPLNSSYDDFALAWMPGTSYGMFSSNRPGGEGWDDIYAFRKLPEPPAPIKETEPLPAMITGFVKDKTTLRPMPNATVFVLNEETDEIVILKTDDKGAYSHQLKTPAQLIVKATTKGYIADCMTWPEEHIKAGETTPASRDLLLDKLAESKTFVIENIYYDFDKYNIRPDAEPPLENLVRIMKDNPINVELSSHTDCRGSYAYNDKLSQNRAESAVRYIIAQGIDPSRITAKGYGEYKLTNRCSDGVPCSAAEHQANRRTEFKVISTSTTIPEKDLFNPDQFKAGETINRSALPPDFFMQCK
ncbi:MAG TPA: OmpA family protein [Bacteroidales bacterium]|nr:OmpA family protein [Bacteroidales bacterium]HPT02843.1 OmpA family protein [Bacteroidales bacterium]